MSNSQKKVGNENDVNFSCQANCTCVCHTKSMDQGNLPADLPVYVGKKSVPGVKRSINKNALERAKQNIRESNALEEKLREERHGHISK